MTIPGTTIVSVTARRKAIESKSSWISFFPMGASLPGRAPEPAALVALERAWADMITTPFLE
jgi:hypothetical protein